MAIGHPEIDADHQLLIYLVNTVELVLRHPEHIEQLSMAFDELERYAHEHFEREEKIQVAWGYRHLDEHKGEHRKLLDSLKLLRKTVEQAIVDSDDPQAAVRQHSEHVSQFLRSWLLDHVVKVDTGMRELFIKSKVF
ncbi:hemerythrin [Pseudothauera lacus]|uniref:Hemerythrin n=1 Tax=Pseudothauera lacus TaxID=2136175 RepID=A0A2T4IKD9_9RHOO|nr:hemerythrin [Pseudothauera lacus]